MPNVITGLLYSDEVFAELQRLLRENPQFQLTMSIDVWSENYGRKLKGYTDEELFNLTVERVVAILNEFGNTRAGLRLTVTDDSADFIKLTNLIKSKLLIPDLNITVEPVTDSELSQKTITKMVECATMWNDSEKIIMGPSRRFCFNPITTPGAYTNIIGDCNQLFGGITIDPYGNLHGCSETVTHSNEFLLTEELGSVRCNTWDKCNDCDFNSLCGGLCYAVRPTGTSCSWRVFNVLEAIYQSFQKMGKDKMKEAIKLNNEETI
jgi:radical SAM protein with 4Fe4S-binding SPASM domain